MYMNVVKVVTLVVPLVTYPYLVGVVGLELFGLIAWMWAIMDLLIIFINYAFEISMTKEVSLFRDNVKKLSKIYTSVLLVKIIFLMIAFAIFLTLLFFNNALYQHRELFYYFFLITIPEVIMPLWYFRGIEKMQFVAILTSATKVGFAVMVFLVVKTQEDYVLVPLLYAIAGFVSAISANYYLFAKENIKLVRVSSLRLRHLVVKGLPLFGSNSLFAVREKATVIIIERLLGLESVAYFDLLQKFVNILITPFHIMSSSLYPHTARTKDIALLKKVIVLAVLLGTIVYVASFIFSEKIIAFLFKHHYDFLVPILHVLSMNVIFGLVSAFIGLNVLAVFSQNKKYFYSSLYSTIVFFGIVGVLWVLHLQINLLMFSVILVVPFVVEMCLRIVFGWKFLFTESRMQ